MKLIRYICLTTIVVLCSGACLRGEDRCSNRSLLGGYGFHISGTNIKAGVSFAVYGKFVADGKGNVTGSGTESVSGEMFNVKLNGTYNVSGDCTGKAKLAFGSNEGVTNLDFVLVEDGNELFIIVADEGVIETGVAKKQHQSPIERRIVILLNTGKSYREETGLNEHFLK